MLTRRIPGMNGYHMGWAGGGGEGGGRISKKNVKKRSFLTVYNN